MRPAFLLVILLLVCCRADGPGPVPAKEFRKVFAMDPRYPLRSFQPSGTELAAFEDQLLRHLEMLTAKGIGYERKVLDRTHPLEYSLGWFKRRYFGHVDATGDRKILAELVFVRCAGNVEWDVIDYSSEAHPDCWWSVMYDIGTHRIEQVNYP